MEVCPNPEDIVNQCRSDTTGETARHVTECDACQEALLEQIEESNSGSTIIDKLPEQSDLDTAFADRLLASVRNAAEEHIESDLTLPYEMGDYTLLKTLGAGGMGIVYLAKQHSLNRNVAIKMVRQSQLSHKKLVSRFHLEVESAARLNHPGIVPIYEVGRHGKFLYYSMQWIDGVTLADHLKTHKLSPKDVAGYAKQIAEAIEYAHENGVIHRDLKPSNILMNADGSLKVADFGLAKSLNSDSDLLTGSYDILGTPAYMSPEQVNGKQAQTVTTDVYGLGAVMYEMLAGSPPFAGSDPVAILHDVVNRLPASLRVADANIPRDLETITSKCLEKSPDKRYPSAVEVAADLDRFLNFRPILARPTPLLEKFSRLVRRNLLASCVLSISAIVIMLSGAYASSSSQELQDKIIELEVKEFDLSQAVFTASQQTDLATSQASLSLDVIEGILGDIQTTYSKLPSQQKMRKTILEDVLVKLNRIPNENVDRDRLNFCFARTYLGLADVEFRIGNQDGSAGLQASRQTYETAIDRLRELHKDNTNNLAVQRILARALLQYGDVLADAAHWKAAKHYFLDALPLIEEVYAEQPTLDVATELGELEILCSEAYMHTGNEGDFESFCTRGYQRLLEAKNANPDDLEANSLFMYACQIYGDWHLKHRRPTETQRYFENFRQTAERLENRYPFESSVKLDCSTAYERLGNLALSDGDLDLARDHYQASLDYAQKLEISARDNLEVLWHVSFSYQHLADILHRRQEWDTGLPHAERCVEIRQLLHNGDPGNLRRAIKLQHSLSTLLRYYQSMDQLEAAESCRVELERIRSTCTKLSAAQ